MKQYSHNRHIFCAALYVLAILAAGCGGQQGSDTGGGHGAAANEVQDFERGPHNGRLLHDGDFSADMRTGLPETADEMYEDLLEECVELARPTDQRLAQSWRPSLSA